MRKKYVLGALAILMVVLGIVCYARLQMHRIVLKIEREGVPYLTVNTEHSANVIRLWQSEADGNGYFFLPSCARRHTVMVGDIGTASLRIDGELLAQGDIFTWEENHAYAVQITEEAYETHTYTVTFMKSENIPAVFIDTASGSMEYLDADKEHEETGNICIVETDGNTEYQGALERISGRGNSTWEYEKKPYAIKLSEKYPLCGLDKGDRWRLLALWREGSRLDNKVAMDLAEELGLPYSPQGTWVDLYLNGTYAGIYLLAESVSVGEGRVEITDLEKENRRCNADIDQAERFAEENSKGYLIGNDGDLSGGYLIEKDHPDHYDAEASGFVTSAGHQFTVNAPQHLSREQAQYIRDYVENIEQLVQGGQAEVWDYLDAESFVKRFLIDEISMNTDTGLTSMYFYKERGDGKLYSGPAWDYDNAFGERNADGEPGYDYEHTVLQICSEEPNRLDWYVSLYDTPEMKRLLVEEYQKVLPFFERMLADGIDGYAQTVSASVDMDHVRWESCAVLGDYTGTYVNYDSNIRYMKYFLARRLNWLCDRWGVEHEEFAVPSNGQMHTITYANYEGVICETQMPDGAELTEPLAYDDSVYQGWANQVTGKPYRRQIPIYEDTVFYNARWE